MKVTFDITDWKDAHKRDPKGHGLWIFTASASDGRGAWTDLEGFTFSGMFHAALAAARKHFADQAAGIGQAKEVAAFLAP